ncbi:acetyl-CoA carboxylase carboxyltransferase subunit alpha [Candidatus Chlorohelix sp.]|uniref:acetyl-CoA carboxylase carboxyltransferase subunit alpha n=1 Tax=Candidatus Chlorohelix sp. TaxID=3139201 RepID=UPI00303BFC00
MPGKEKKDNPINNAAWEKVLLARHARRPHALDFMNSICKDFVELHGDRRFGDDSALVAGIAKFNKRSVIIMGQQKGRDTKENIARNFGSPRAEGYRKALRLFQQAEKFGMPIITLIDTGGAYPGKDSEERGVGLAIAENLMELCRIKVPTIAVVTGEGGSGGALAIGIADRLLMLENAIYSVASPEAAASILWKDAAQAPAAALAMKITAEELKFFGIIDEIVPEPAGGAHNDPPALMITLAETLERHLSELEQSFVTKGEAGIQAMLETRYNKYRVIGHWGEVNVLAGARE